VGISREDFLGEYVADIVCHPNPVASFFFGKWVGFQRVMVPADGFMKHEVEVCGTIWCVTMADGSWNLPPNGFIGTNIMDVGQVFGCLEPQDGGRGAGAIQEGLSVHLHSFDGTHFRRVLLGMIGFSVFIGNKICTFKKFSELESSLHSRIVTT